MRNISFAFLSLFTLLLISCGGESTTTDQSAQNPEKAAPAPPTETTSKQPSGTDEMQFKTVAAHLLGGFLIKDFELQGDKAKLTYAKSLKEVNVKGNTNLSPDEYWKTAKRLEKYFPLAAYSMLDELPFINQLEAIIPYGGKTYHMDIKRSDFEKYVGHTFAELKKNPHEMFHYIHVRKSDGRQKFADRFVKIQ